MEWKTVRGTQKEKPKSLEIGTEYVFIRKSIHAFSETDSEDTNKISKGWEYDEIILTKAQYVEFVKITGNPFYVSDTEDIKSRILNVETYIATSTIE